jgi:uncharacterized protein YbaR (Trm112 family)
MEKEIISTELLDILACPACKNQVELIEYREKMYGLRCAQCQCIYPIKDGIPIMLIDEAIKEKAL